ncbi:MAG TPA: Mur ligase domain-containing protein [Candidatus Saccharimonadales bacterium]|nr:Mur ligase domain-containing protein [Candidatus Saccharimonadales bacterium]
MHVYFSGIGGTAISSLALIAYEAGYTVSGSDARPSAYLDYLAKHGVTDTHIGVDADFIAQVHARQPIDWFVYGSAQPIDFPDHPEFDFCRQNGIRMSKRDELLGKIIKDKRMKLIAVAGTHGKTTTTAMATWVFKKLDVPVSYSGGAKLSFGDVSEFSPESRYFVYEADEYDRNFLGFYPAISMISGIDYDHPDVYPTRQSYEEAFLEFFEQSDQVVIWHDDAERLAIEAGPKYSILDRTDPAIEAVRLPGLVNRQDAWLVAQGLSKELGRPAEELVDILDGFPGLSRRFEQIIPNLYTDAAHTPPKIRGALQLAQEVAGDNVVVVYEGLHNLRQHFIKDELRDLFNTAKALYVAPSYLAREDKDLELLTPDKLISLLSEPVRARSRPAALDESLEKSIQGHLDSGDLVLCLSAGGAGSLDEWLRRTFPPR